MSEEETEAHQQLEDSEEQLCSLIEMPLEEDDHSSMIAGEFDTEFELLEFAPPEYSALGSAAAEKDPVFKDIMAV